MVIFLLWQTSLKKVLAEETGFEPAEVLPSPVFETGAINQALPLLYILIIVLLIIQTICFDNAEPIIAYTGCFSMLVLCVFMVMTIYMQ